MKKIESTLLVVSTVVLIILYVYATQITWEWYRGMSSIWWIVYGYPTIYFQLYSFPILILNIILSTRAMYKSTSRFYSFWYYWSIFLLIVVLLYGFGEVYLRWY